MGGHLIHDPWTEYVREVGDPFALIESYAGLIKGGQMGTGAGNPIHFVLE